MKVLVLANNDVGLYRFRRELIERLLSDGHTVAAALPDGSLVPAIEALGCRCVHFDFDRRGKNPLAELALLRRYRALLRAEKPDLVLTYTVKPNIYGGLACRRYGVPYLANITGLGDGLERPGPLRAVLLWLYRRALAEARCVFFQNAANRALFERQGIVRGRTRLLPGSGVNTAYHTMTPYPPLGEPVRFLFVGRLLRDKGVGELLAAARRLLAAGNPGAENTAVRFDVVGGADDEVLADQVRAAQADGVLTYHGQQEEVRPFLRQCSAVVLPSYHEGMANVLLEAAATGRPVIATDVPGCRETFTDGVTGLAVPPRDADALYMALAHFAAMAYNEREEMGIRAHTKVCREFDRQLVVDAYLEEIQHVREDTHVAV